MADGGDAVPPLPAGWSKKLSTKRNIHYYINAHTGETQWEVPTKPAENKKRKSSSGDGGVHDGSDNNDEKKVQCLHILKKHAGSRRPSSWRQEVIAQSKEESIEQINAIRADLLRCDDAKALRERFKDVASRESDCSSATRGGDLGPFARGAMQKAFESAAFALEIGQLSGIVDTDSGIHVILRIA